MTDRFVTAQAALPSTDLAKVNVYCTVPGETVVRHNCPCCERCWLYVTGPRTGRCAYGGPFKGYIKMDEDTEHDS